MRPIAAAAGRRHAGGQRRLEHLAGLAGVADDQHARVRGAGLQRGRPPEREREVGGEALAGDPADAVGAEEPAAVPPFRSAGGTQRLENCGRLRAFLRPAFLRSFTRGSRVRKPRRLSSPRRFGSASRSARLMPWRSAPAWADTPPPCRRATTSIRASKPTASTGWGLLA